MAETGSYTSPLVQVGEVTGVSAASSTTFFEMRIADEAEAARYYRNPYDYLEQLLEREGRPASEIHVIRSHTPIEGKPPLLRGNVLHRANCVFI